MPGTEAASGAIRVLVLFGTRPEVIKLAPVVEALRARPVDFVTRTCSTGQHREMLQHALDAFELEPDIRLSAMESAETMAGLTARLFVDIDEVVAREQPDWVIVQGDTTSAMVGAMVAFYRRIKVAHVEAGLRTGDRWRPFPEEINRAIVARVTDLHFAPTPGALSNLLREGIDPASVHVTGNTVVDAVHSALQRLGDRLPEELGDGLARFVGDRRMLLVTGHRRESFGPGLDNICRALVEIVESHTDVVVVYPVHMNPNVRVPVRRALAEHSRIRVLEPVGYLALLWLMRCSCFVLTDSGGIQEEAPSLGRRVLVMRTATERPELIESGWGQLVGTDREAITAAATALLRGDLPTSDRSLANPFGDGCAAERIVDTIYAQRSVQG